MGPEIAVNDLNDTKSENLVLRKISLKFTLMYVGWNVSWKKNIFELFI